MKYFCLSIQPSLHLCRSSHQRCSVRKCVLRNFTKFTEKNLCQSLFFKKVVGLRPATLLKKRLWCRCFPVNFAKFPRTSFSQNTSGRLLLYVSHQYKFVFAEKRYRVKFDRIRKNLLLTKQKQKKIQKCQNVSE